MIRLEYENNAKTEHIELYGDFRRVTSGNFHVRSWELATKAKQYGVKVNKIKKSAVSYALTFTLRGKLDDRYVLLNSMMDIFEKDVVNETPGRLYFGDQYIECYALTSETKVNETYNYWTDVTVAFYCPYPFWIEEKSFFLHTASSQVGLGHNYIYNYAHDYTGGEAGQLNINTGHFAPSNFVLQIQGAATNPQMVIGGHTYKVNVVLNSGDRLEIDSRNNSIYKISQSGTKTNCFGDRATAQSVFEKIKPGENTVSWSGQFDANLIIYNERSEPRWS